MLHDSENIEASVLARASALGGAAGGRAAAGRAAGPNFIHYFTVQQGKVTVQLLQKINN